jgi:hypothetical protein
MARLKKPSIKIEDVTQAELEDAIDAVLTELIAYRLRPRCGPPEPMKSIHFSKLLDKPIRSRRACSFLGVLRDPIEGAFLYTVRGIGEALFDLGGTRSMKKSLENVAARDPANEGRRLSICDSRWDGIGAKPDIWIA